MDLYKDIHVTFRVQETLSATEELNGWGFQSSDFRRCVDGWVIPDVLNERIAFIFRGV